MESVCDTVIFLVQWKSLNLQKLAKQNPQKLQEETEKLCAIVWWFVEHVVPLQGKQFINSYKQLNLFKTMKRKQYEKPSIEVVVLKQAGMLMTSESVNVTMDGTWTEETI